jgi:lipopolysaccharide transport system permease protein
MTVAAARALWRIANPVANVAAIFTGAAVVARNFSLASQLAHRDLAARYKGQIVGAVWMVAHPMLLMLIYLFIFGVVFKQKLGGSYDLPRDYTTYILSGLVPWLACVPAFSTTCYSVLGSANLVKQFHFDTAALPLREVVSTFYFWGVGLAFITIYNLAVERSLPWTYILLPVLLLLTFLLVAGLGWIFAAVTVFFRDLKDIIQVLMTMFVYILPIVYLPQWTPPIFQQVITFNPFSYMIWTFQDVFYFGRIAHPGAWIVFPIFALLSFALGHRVFKGFRPYFGNAL